MISTALKSSPALAAVIMLAISAQAQEYHFAFDDPGGDPTVNSGTGTAVATQNGSVVLTAPGSYGATVSHGLWDSAGATNPNGDSIDLDLTGQGIVLGQFALDLDILFNAGTSKFDDWLSFTLSDGSLYFLTTGGGPSGVDGTTKFSGPAGISSTLVLNDGAWHSLSVVGTTVGADALLEYFIDGSSQGTNTHVGGASAAFQLFQIGGRADGLFNRHMSGGIDEVMLSVVMNPGTSYCFGNGSGTACPCANNNNGGQGGCDWGSALYPEGGVLSAVGSNSMAANDTFLVATGIENNFGIFFGANDQVNGGNGNPLNDGLRCAGGALVRLVPPTSATGHQAVLPMPVQTLDINAASGVTRRYQYWFRTPGGPCATSANLTNGYEIVWMP